MKYLNVKEAATHLGITEQHVRRKCENGILHAVKENGRWKIDPNSHPRLVESIETRELIDTAELLDVPANKRQKAIRRLGLIRAFEEFASAFGGRRGEAISKFAAEYKIGKRSLYRWIVKYRDQGLLGLVDTRGGGKFIGQTISDEAFELFKSMYLTQQQLSLKTCWQNVCFVNKDQNKGWKIPSVQGMYRIIKQRIPMPVQILHREGLAAYQAKCAPYIQTDPESIEPGSVWVGDHSEFNCKIFYQGRWQRPWLTAWMDLRSRTIVGWHISFSPNQTTVLLAMKRAVEKYGPPDLVKIDNGKDYDSEMFTGTTKVKRRMIRRGYLDEQMVAGIYAMMDIAISFAIPYHPQSKAIERVFDTIDRQFTKTFKTYCGKDTLRKPENHKELLKNEKLAEEFTIEKFTEQFGNYVKAYNSTSHTGAGMNGRTPLEILATRQSRRVLPEGVAELLLRVWSRELIVGKNGVRFRGIYYGQYDTNLLMHQGKRVRVNYDPDDLRTIHVYDAATMVLLAVAHQNELIRYGRAVDEQSLRDAMRQKSRAVKIARQFRDSRLVANMDLTDLTIAAMQEAVKEKSQDKTKQSKPRLRPVITPLNKQVKEIQKRDIIKAVKRASGAESVTEVLDLDFSLLKPEQKSVDLELIDE